MPDARQPDLKMGVAAPGVVFGIRRRGMLPPFHKWANAAGGILLVDQGQDVDISHLQQYNPFFQEPLHNQEQ